MPHDRKERPEEIDESLGHSPAETRPTWKPSELPHNLIPDDQEHKAWRPSDEATQHHRGHATSEVLDEAEDEWRPSDGADH